MYFIRDILFYFIKKEYFTDKTQRTVTKQRLHQLQQQEKSEHNS